MDYADDLKRLYDKIDKVEKSLSAKIEKGNEQMSTLQSDVNFLKLRDRPTVDCRTQMKLMEDTVKAHCDKEAELLRRILLKSFLFTGGSYIFTWVIFLILNRGS